MKARIGMIEKDLTLEKVTKLLPEVTNQLIEARKRKDKAEVKYYSRFHSVLLFDQTTEYRNQKMKEAEAKRVCELEGLEEEVRLTKGEYTDLYFERETLIEIARNLRVLGKEIKIIGNKDSTIPKF